MVNVLTTENSVGPQSLDDEKRLRARFAADGDCQSNDTNCVQLVVRRTGEPDDFPVPVDGGQNPAGQDAGLMRFGPALCQAPSELAAASRA